MLFVISMMANRDQWCETEETTETIHNVELQDIESTCNKLMDKYKDDVWRGSQWVEIYPIWKAQ